MQVIINFFAGIANGIGNIVDFFISFIADFIDFLLLMGKLPRMLTGIISWIPVEFAAGIGVILSVVILYKILGRD